MAYMSQDRKKELAPQIKAVLKKYNVKGSVAVRHHSTLVVNLKSGSLDLVGNHNETTGHSRETVSVNPYWAHDHFTGQCKEFILELLKAMNVGNHDRSEIQVDYFDVGWYVDVNIGQWNKPYEVV